MVKIKVGDVWIKTFDGKKYYLKVVKELNLREDSKKCFKVEAGTSTSSNDYGWMPVDEDGKCIYSSIDDIYSGIWNHPKYGDGINLFRCYCKGNCMCFLNKKKESEHDNYRED